MAFFLKRSLIFLLVFVMSPVQADDTKTIKFDGVTYFIIIMVFLCSFFTVIGEFSKCYLDKYSTFLKAGLVPFLLITVIVFNTVFISISVCRGNMVCCIMSGYAGCKFINCMYQAHL